jgi:hypothetical protein
MDTHDLATSYVALWNEPDAVRRGELIRSLWAVAGRQVLQPPEELRQAADRLGFPAATLEARGHAAMEIRVARAYDEFVAPGTYSFTLRGDARRLADVVLLSWAMTPVTDGTPAGGGVELLTLDAEDRITADYQFIDA